MIRRLLPLALSLVAVATLASCGTFSNNHEAVSVNGVALDRSDLERYTIELFKLEKQPVADANKIREFLNLWIYDEISRQLMATQGVTIDDSTIEEATAQADAYIVQNGLTASDDLRSFIIDSIATTITFDSVPADAPNIEFAKAAKIVVDPRYGRWDLDSRQVIALR